MSIAQKSFAETILTRQSMRAFTDQEIAADVMQDIFEMANATPSNCNTQIWRAHVVSGETRDAVAADLSGGAMAQNFDMDYPYTDKIYDKTAKDNQATIAKAMFDAAGIERDDKMGRMMLVAQNFQFFGAPYAVFLCGPDWMTEREIADLGAYGQSLMLAMWSHGIGSVPQTTLGMQRGVLAKHLNIPEDQKLLYGISFGYPEMSHDLNTYRTPRMDVADIVSFYT